MDEDTIREKELLCTRAEEYVKLIDDPPFSSPKSKKKLTRNKNVFNCIEHHQIHKTWTGDCENCIKYDFVESLGSGRLPSQKQV